MPPSMTGTPARSTNQITSTCSTLRASLLLACLLSAAATVAADPLLIGTDSQGRDVSAAMVEVMHDGEPVWVGTLEQLPDEAVTLRVAESPQGEAVGTVRARPELGVARVLYDDRGADAGEIAALGPGWQLFAFDPGDRWDVAKVNLAGGFNGWNREAMDMHRGPDGVYRAMVQLGEGVHQYKFVVTDAGGGVHWVPDPNADPTLNVGDGHGGHNSGVFIGLDARKLPAPQPEAVNPAAVRFDPDRSADLSVAGDGLVRVALRAQAADVAHAELRIVREAGKPAQRAVPMHVSDAGMGFDRFTATFTVQGPFRYVIDLHDGDTTLTLAQSGKQVSRGGVATSEAREPFQCELRSDFETPDWAKDAVWYQIFPERFRNGDPANDPGRAGTAYDTDFEHWLPWESQWFALHPEFGEVGDMDQDFYTGKGWVWQRRYGGDMQGVIEKLPYLRELGVNAIYFNPVFEGESMHKYDASDYRHIDDNFGVVGDLPVPGEGNDPDDWKWSPSDKVFLELLKEARDQGFRVIIDGVFNHVGRAHFAFMDVLEQGKNSPYADWFEITDWGDPTNWRPMEHPFEVHGKPGGIQWQAWDQSNGHLPALKKDAELGLKPGPRQHIFDITRRWMDPNGDGDPSDGIDGWRLDVPHDVPAPFWRDWRKLVKSINPDAYITGEVWNWAQSWVQGDQFDAVMNYQFAMAAQDFFVDRDTAIPPSQFAQRLNELVYNYPLPAALVMQNLFDSHDTDRFASMIVNPDRPYDGANRPQDNAQSFDGPPYSDRKPTSAQWDRMKLAVTCQMTFLGAPMIYYGNETGMWSPDDPSNRQPMVWRDLLPYEDPRIEFNEDLFAHHQRLIALRHQLEPLRRGGFRTLLTDDARGLIAYSRELNGQQVIVVLNRSDRPQRVNVPVDADNGARFTDWLNPRQAELIDEIDPDDDSTTRPIVRPLAGATPTIANRGALALLLPANGSAVLTTANAPLVEAK